MTGLSMTSTYNTFIFNMGLSQVGCALLLLYHLQCSLCCRAPPPSPPTPPTTPPSLPSPTSPPPVAVSEDQSAGEFCLSTLKSPEE